jgi:hypothetical protein
VGTDIIEYQRADLGTMGWNPKSGLMEMIHIPSTRDEADTAAEQGTDSSIAIATTGSQKS